MSRRKIEKSLRKMGKHAPRVSLDAAKAVLQPEAPAAKVKRSAFYPRAPWLRPILVTACMLLLVLMPVGGVRLHTANTTQLYIEAEDTVVLTVSPFGNVKGALWQSAAGEIFVADAPHSSLLVLSCAAAEPNAFPVEINGLAVEEAVEIVIDYMAKASLLPDGCEVIISSAAGSERRADRVAAIAQEAVLKSTEAGLSTDRVVVEGARPAAKGQAEAEHSPAKDKYLNDLKDIPTSYTEEELEKFSAGYLRYLIREHQAERGEMPEEERPSPQADRYYKDYADKKKPSPPESERADDQESHGRPPRDD